MTIMRPYEIDSLRHDEVSTYSCFLVLVLDRTSSVMKWRDSSCISIASRTKLHLEKVVKNPYGSQNHNTKQQFTHKTNYIEWKKKCFLSHIVHRVNVVMSCGIYYVGCLWACSLCNLWLFWPLNVLWLLSFGPKKKKVVMSCNSS